MKKIFILLLITTSIKSQVSNNSNFILKPFHLDSNTIITKYYPLYIEKESEWKRESYIMQDSSENIVIKGDTVLLIKMLLKKIKENTEIEITYLETIRIGVRYINHLPSRYLSSNENCIWNRYYKKLNNLGYYLSETKKPLDCK